jgi:hypothetical protein
MKITSAIRAYLLVLALGLTRGAPVAADHQKTTTLASFTTSVGHYYRSVWHPSLVTKKSGSSPAASITLQEQPTAVPILLQDWNVAKSATPHNHTAMMTSTNNASVSSSKLSRTMPTTTTSSASEQTEWLAGGVGPVLPSTLPQVLPALSPEVDPRKTVQPMSLTAVHMPRQPIRNTRTMTVMVKPANMTAIREHFPHFRLPPVKPEV